MTRLLPKPNELKGWKEVAGSFVRAKGDGLMNLYDGGYKLYLDHGVTEAAQRIYQRGPQYVTLTVHAVKDAKSAAVFVAYWSTANSRQKKGPTPAPGTGFLMSANGATTIYWSRGSTFVTISCPDASVGAAANALATLRLVAKKTKP